MDKFKFLEHTADAKFQAFGKSLEDAFGNAALAMFSVMTEPEKVERKIKREIKAKGDDEKSLLYDFLEQLLILLETEGFLLNHVEKIKIVDGELTAVAVGDKISEKYDVHGEVKAVTYNEMDIKREKHYFMVQVVVDL